MAAPAAIYPRLKNRQMQIPGGLGFYLPEVKWRAKRGSSFNSIADGLQHVVKGNRALAQKHNWPTDRRSIEEWVDRYNATVCARMGWDNYIMAEGSVSTPKSSPRHLQETLKSVGAAVARAKELVAGARSLMEWEDSGDPPVDPDQALERAIRCSQCPINQPGDWTEWFTVPAAELIKRRIEKAQRRGLKTPRDDDLHLCTACHCPLKLKVHVPIDWIIKRLTPEQKEGLRDGKDCWILEEMGSR